MKRKDNKLPIRKEHIRLFRRMFDKVEGAFLAAKRADDAYLQSEMFTGDKTISRLIEIAIGDVIVRVTMEMERPRD